MKRRLLSSLLLGVLACGGHHPGDREPVSATTPYSLETYPACRDAFLGVAAGWLEQEAGELSYLPIASATGEELGIDVLYLPARERPERLLILTSGLHGTEGFVGSAVQRMFLREILQPAQLDRLGVLVIHGINVWGFSHLRRVTENNVDLNRNFALDASLFDTPNEGYLAVDGLLNPSGSVNLRSLGNRFFTVKAMANIVRYSMGALRQAVLQGQYEHERGIYFGGHAFEPHKAALEPLLREKVSGYDTVFIVDLHTGYGERGRLHLFPNPVEDAATREAVEDLFPGQQVDWGDSDDFYTIHGSFVDWVGLLLGDGQRFRPMVFEYGTLDSQTTSGSIDSIHRTILENQGFQYGYVRSEDKEEVLRLHREMFYPSDPAWRAQVMEQSRQVLRQALRRYLES